MDYLTALLDFDGNDGPLSTYAIAISICSITAQQLKRDDPRPGPQGRDQCVFRRSTVGVGMART